MAYDAVIEMPELEIVRKPTAIYKLECLNIPNDKIDCLLGDLP